VRMADNLQPSSADVTESGSLNLPEPSGPHRPVMGLVYLFLPLKYNVMLVGFCVRQFSMYVMTYCMVGKLTYVLVSFSW
jgi:hypothetical protein